MCNVPEDIQTSMAILCGAIEEQPNVYAALVPYALRIEYWLKSLPTMPQPDWSQAPEWAEWWYVNSTGVAYFTDAMPRAEGGSGFYPMGNRQQYRETINLPLGIDWRCTLQRRPNP